MLDRMREYLAQPFPEGELTRCAMSCAITDWHPVGNEPRPPADEVNANGAVGRKRPASPEVALPGT
jgi:hypothetical protein